MSPAPDLMSTPGRPGQLGPRHDVARQTVVAAGDRVGAADRRAVDEALRLADLWLDPVTSLPSGAAPRP